MDNVHLLAQTDTITLENGIKFHSKVIGLTHFLVPLERALKEGYSLVIPNDDNN